MRELDTEVPLPPLDLGENNNRKDVLKAILLIIVFSGSLAIIRFSPLGNYLDTSNINHLRIILDEFHSLAPFIFLAGGTLVISMGAPRLIISALGGMIFGFFWGTVLSMAATIGGSLVVFALTRHLGRPLFNQNVGVRLKAIKDHIGANGLLAVIIMRQLPLACLLVNILIGLTSISVREFLLGSLIGHLPEALIFSLYGSSLRGSFIFRIVLASLLLIMLVVALRIYFRRNSQARDLAQKLTGKKTI